ncbi:single-stranded-DNA-specific exonuclease RecJ [Aestuariivirga litoralis]|uniref:single-stranded-DNA-specific exonuclease RecJ n=1 Tax=Aestuariivirga litoralis TaxID=2650924 RepID=UPI00315C87E1
MIADATSRPFLNVERSASARRWKARLDDQRIAEAISQRHELPEIIGRVLAARGVGIDEAEAFLNPTIRTLMPQPSALRDMEKGAARLAEAITTGEKIGVIADYDVDGVSSAAMLVLFLRAVGSSCSVHIPDRLTEGYGPSLKAVESLKAQGAQVLVTLDCGVMAHDPLLRAAELGMTTIIVDHHQAGEVLPEAYAVINPNRQDDTSGLGYLCAAGVTMIFIATVNKLLRLKGWYGEARPEPNMLRWLELVSLATVCDVVPLKGLNRAYVTQGLKIMARRENLGIACLADVARLKRRPDTYALGYLLGPRINAAGRIGNAGMALTLLTTQDKGEAAQIAQELERLNRERQEIELAVVDQAMVQADNMLGRERRGSVLVVSGRGWHPGVVGLAAARLKERFSLPSFVLAEDRDGKLASGSGRSVPGVDIGSAVREAFESGLIVKGGGHAMAAGLTLEAARLGDLRGFLEERLGPQVAAAQDRALAIDAALTAGAATLELIELLEQAGPYGTAHPSPVFAFPAHRVLYADRAGGDHIRCTLASSDGKRLKAVAFRAMGTELGELLLSEKQLPLHVAGRLTIDDWSGARVPCLHIEDAARVS